MTDTDRIARLERLVKTLLRGTAQGTFGMHRTRHADPDELAAALAWVNSDEGMPIVDKPAVTRMVNHDMVDRAVANERKRGKR